MKVEDLPEMGSQSVGKAEVEHIMDAPGENFDEHDTFPVPENSVSQPQHGQEDDSGVRGGENRWTGWPGDNVYRLLVPVHKVGGIIGRKGEFIKKMCEETGARIKILDGPQGTEERAVMVSAKEEPDRALPPAIDGLLRVHERIIDGLDGDPTHAPPGSTSSRLLMDASQAGNLIGKQGTTIKSIQEASNCIIRVLGPEALPVFSLQDDRVVEILGEPAAVHKALELAATHLRKFLVDRSVIVQFEKQMQNPSPHMEQNMPPHQSWAPSPQGFPQNAGGGPGFGPGPQYMMPPPPRHHDNYYPPSDMPPMEKPPHQGLSMYGRDASVGANSSSNVPPPQTVMAQITQHMQIPLSYADAVIGNAGGNISYTRRASGATITIQETRGVPGEMTVEINGSASQVQTAQQLIQNFMAEAAAGSAHNQGSGPPDNSYPTHNSVYSSPPNLGHTGQSATGYNSGYNNNYGGANNNSYSATAAANYPAVANNYPAATNNNNYPPANNYGGANNYNANYGY